MTRTAFGGKRGDFGISAKACAGRVALSIVSSDPETPMIPHDTHLQIGSLLFEGVDQIDLTGPFEVLSRLPNSTYRIYARTLEPIRDVRGLRLLADATLSQAPQLDVIHVPGGVGQED